MYYDIKKSGQRIRQLREGRKETQETLSEKLNISLSLLRKIETGRRGTSIEVLIVFAEYFDTSLDYIVLGRTNSPSDFKDKLRAIITSLEEIEHKLRLAQIVSQRFTTCPSYFSAIHVTIFPEPAMRFWGPCKTPCNAVIPGS